MYYFINLSYLLKDPLIYYWKYGMVVCRFMEDLARYNCKYLTYIVKLIRLNFFYLSDLVSIVCTNWFIFWEE